MIRLADQKLKLGEACENVPALRQQADLKICGPRRFWLGWMRFQGAIHVSHYKCLLPILASVVMFSALSRLFVQGLNDDFTYGRNDQITAERAGARYSNEPWFERIEPNCGVKCAAVQDNVTVIENDVTSVRVSSVVPMGSPVSNRLFAITMTSDESGWIVGDEGVILSCEETTWKKVSSPTTYRLYDIVMTEPDAGWAVGDYGTVLRFTDGMWTLWPQQLPINNLHAVGMLGLDVGWIVGRLGIILAYNGSTWSEVGSPTTYPLFDIAIVSPTLAFAVGGGGSVLAYRGDSWKIQPSPTQVTLNAVAMNGPDEGWAVGDRGTILYYDGADWTLVDSPVRDSLQDLLIISWDDIWAVGQAGLLIHYDGVAWSQIASPAQHSLYGLSRVPDGDLWAVGFAATILHHSNGQWEEATRLTSATLRDLLWDGDVGWAVGDNGQVLHNNGSGWMRISAPTTITLHALGQAAPSDIWAVGDCGAILHHDGADWSVATSPTTLTLRGVIFSGPMDGWIVGGDRRPSIEWSDGIILHYDGSTWRVASDLPDQPLNALGFAASDAGWAVGDGGAIWRYDGNDWLVERSPTSRALWSVFALAPDNAWVVGEAGVILHYNGVAWRQAYSPTSTGLHRVLMTGPDEGWALGDSGAILHYDGLAWRVMTSPTTLRLLGGTMDDSGDLWAVGHGGTLFRIPLEASSFQLSVSPQQVFALPDTTVWITTVVSAIESFSRPVMISLSAPREVVSPTWTTTVVTPSAEIKLGLQVSPAPLLVTLLPPEGSTLSLYITASDGHLTHTTGLSLTVTPGKWLSGVSLRSGGRLHDLAYDGNGRIWAVGDDGLIWRYDKTEWHQYVLPVSCDLYTVDALTSTLVWVAGENGTLLRFDGTDWLTSNSPTTMPIFSLVLMNPDVGVAVGGGGTILHYIEEKWQIVPTPGQDWLYDVAMDTDGTGWAVGWGGAIWHYDGDDWQIVDSPTHNWLRAVSVAAIGDVWAVGSEGTILHHKDERWELFPSPTPARLLDVHFDGPNDGWVVGGDGIILRYDETGWHIWPHLAGSDLRSIQWAGSEYGLAVGNDGKVACYYPAYAGTLTLPGCADELVSQTTTLPYQVFLPVVGRNTLGHSPIDIFGVQTMGDNFSLDPDIVNRMAEAGIQWARLPLAWKTIEPANTIPDQFHWSKYDDWLELLSTAGIRPLPILSRNPSWAGVLPASRIDQADEAEQQAFIVAVVDRYSRPPYNISHWEIYNEPDNSEVLLAERGWGIWGYDGAGYADQLTNIYRAVKGTNPTAQVLLGGVAHESFVEAGGPFVRSFVTDVLKSGGGAYFDLMNFHYYGPDLTGRIEYFEDLLAGFGLDKPMACTEVGTVLGDPALENDGELYALYFPKVMMRGLAGELSMVHWFALADTEGTWRPGLFGIDRTTRPVYNVYRVLTRVVRAARYSRPLSSTEMSGLPLEGYVFDVPQGGGRLDVVWVEAPWTGTDVVVDWQVPAPWVYLINKHGGTRYVYDADDGQIDGLTTFKIGLNPLYVLYGR
jgi:photosystem II stability/assembly factor-like uncharacterized protein